MRWTKKDQKRVRDVIDHVAGKLDGGQADIARRLGLRSRHVVQQWRKRGIIPPAYHDSIMEMAPELMLMPAELSPLSRRLSQIKSTLLHANPA